MGIKVLFIYPNTYGMNMIPSAIALFSALLKKEGHKVEIFDSTYYVTNYGIDSDGSKVESLQAVAFNMEDRGIKMKNLNLNRLATRIITNHSTSFSQLRMQKLKHLMIL